MKLQKYDGCTTNFPFLFKRKPFYRDCPPPAPRSEPACPPTAGKPAKQVRGRLTDTSTTLSTSGGEQIQQKARDSNVSRNSSLPPNGGEGQVGDDSKVKLSKPACRQAGLLDLGKFVVHLNTI